MKVLITGASSGIGADMARVFAKKQYELILVARREEKLEQLKKELNTKVTIISLDLSDEKNCYELYNQVKKENIDILINNAGFGLIDNFWKTDLNKELKMIDLNIKTVHILTKLFLQDFVKKDYGYILNVASSAAFMPGPLMATYYASKAYVLHLTEAIYEELRSKKSKVVVSCLCPGPVNTEFNKVAGVRFSLKGLNSYDVAKYSVDKLLKKKLIIIPGITMKISIFLTRFTPRKILLKITHLIQQKKRNRDVNPI